METAAATVEDRIRERAYHLWESSGRPLGRDKEFWLQACEVVAADAEKAPRKRKRPSRPVIARSAATKQSPPA